MSTLADYPARIVFALVTVLLPGCSPTVRQISLDTRPFFIPDNRLDGLECEFRLGKVIDDRRDKESLGKLGFSLLKEGPVTGEAPGHDMVTATVPVNYQDDTTAGVPPDKMSSTMQWLIEGLESAGLNNGKASAIRINVSLKMAYIQNSLSAKVSNIALAFTLENYEKVFIARGTDTAIHWGNGTGEIRNSFNRALEKAIDSLVGEVKHQCGLQNRE